MSQPSRPWWREFIHRLGDEPLGGPAVWAMFGAALASWLAVALFTRDLMSSLMLAFFPPSFLSNVLPRRWRRAIVGVRVAGYLLLLASLVVGTLGLLIP